MNDAQPNNNGVLTNNTITVLQHKDKFIEYSLTKGTFNNKDFFASSVLINGFGIYSGCSGPVSIYSANTEEKEIDFIKTFLKRELSRSEIGLKHLKKLELFQETKQLSLFN